MRKAGRLSEAAVASVARLNPSVRCMSPDRACRGAPEEPGSPASKKTSPRRASMGIGLITVCDAAFRAAPLAPACRCAVPHTRVGTKAGGCYGAAAWPFSPNTNGTFATIGNRFNFTRAQRSRGRVACFRLARSTTSPSCEEFAQRSWDRHAWLSRANSLLYVRNRRGEMRSPCALLMS
jgi:hypothetical protein